MSELEAEIDWLKSRSDRTKILFLSALAHMLTIAGRESYSVLNEGLDKPSQLRTINEIQHRVLACLLQLLNEKPDIGFQESIAGLVLDQPDPQLKQLLSWAWRTSKQSCNDSEVMDQLLDQLKIAHTLACEFKGGSSEHFNSAEEFASALGAAIADLEAGNPAVLEDLSLWFLPTGDWDDLVRSEGLEIGQRVSDLLKSCPLANKG